MLKKIWDSPTITTWMSYSTKALSLFGVLPLILKRFSPSEIVLWYLLWTIISLQGIADFGFRQTFSRIISYAFGGASDVGIFKSKTENKKNDPNLGLLNSIVSSMKYIYVWLTLLLFIIMGVFGTWALIKPIQASTNAHDAWLSWIIVIVVSCISFYGKIYMNFLEGIFKIAMVRRVETLTSLGSILTCIIVLIYAPTLLNLIIANQLWLLIVAVRDWYLCITVDNGFYKSVSARLPFDKEIFSKIWSPTWRSGISAFMNVGLTNISGMVYAQIGNSTDVASYLLALRVINQIKEISMAPFYSKLPLLAMLRVESNLKELTKIARRGIFLSNSVFMFGFVIVGMFSAFFLGQIHSHVPFVTQSMWILLGMAFLVQRYGAMHMQIYTSTNHIISHIADIGGGILYIISAVALVNYIGVYAIPAGMLIGYAGFYAWYCAKYSYSSLDVSFWRFEMQTSLLPVSLMILYICYILINNAMH